MEIRRRGGEEEEEEDQQSEEMEDGEGKAGLESQTETLNLLHSTLLPPLMTVLSQTLQVSRRSFYLRAFELFKSQCVETEGGKRGILGVRWVRDLSMRTLCE